MAKEIANHAATTKRKGDVEAKLADTIKTLQKEKKDHRFTNKKLDKEKSNHAATKQKVEEKKTRISELKTELLNEKSIVKTVCLDNVTLCRA